MSEDQQDENPFKPMAAAQSTTQKVSATQTKTIGSNRINSLPMQSVLLFFL